MKMIGVFVGGLFFGLIFATTIFFGYEYFQERLGLVSPLVLLDKQKEKDLPLLKYKIDNLHKLDLLESKIQIIKKVAENDNFTGYQFSFITQGGSMSGKLNLPKVYQNQRIIVMARGYVPPEIFESGVGTQAAAEVFVKEGFITVAPDFLGFGESSPDFVDTWEGRFVKSIQVMELINNLENTDFSYLECQFRAEDTGATCREKSIKSAIGIWAHSNGGQIVLTTLEGFGVSYPTTLWAPVTAPFPYSVLFFSDEASDEGKASRNWISLFEKDYDVFDFSLTRHLDRLQGPLRIHHGTADEAALFSWSLEFADRIDAENKRREEQILANKQATAGAELDVLNPIDYELLRYEGADHNLRPSWPLVVARDVAFFKNYLGNN